MRHSSHSTQWGRWLPNIRTVRIKLSALLSALRAIGGHFGKQYGTRDGKLRGPVLWLGDLNKHDGGGGSKNADSAGADGRSCRRFRPPSAR